MGQLLKITGTDEHDVLDDFAAPPGAKVRFIALGGDDEIYAETPDAAIDAGAGDDVILCAGGLLSDGDGNDTIQISSLATSFRFSNGAGDDYLDIAAAAVSGASVTIRDGAGSDTYLVRGEGVAVVVRPDIHDPAGNDSYLAAAGTGTISYAGTTQGIMLSLQSGAFGEEIGEDKFQGFSRATGGDGNDTMYTDIDKGGTLSGGAGDDTLWGGRGNDILNGGDGWDNIEDHGGFARIDTGTGDANVQISCTGGVITLGDGANLLELKNDDVISAGTFTVTLNSNNNGIYGTDANETFILKGEGFATVDLRQNGTVITGNALTIVNGALDTTGETVKLTGSEDRYAALEGTAYQGIDRFFTGGGDDVISGSHSAYNALSSGSGDDEINCYAEKTDVSAGRGNDLVMTWSGASFIDMGNGIDRVFCRGGSSTVLFNAATAKAHDQLWVFEFHKGTDTIDLDAATDAAAFLASGHEATLADQQGLQFVTASGAMLFIAGLTAADLSADLFV